jgi:hypothetical protein
LPPVRRFPPRANLLRPNGNGAWQCGSPEVADLLVRNQIIDRADRDLESSRDAESLVACWSSTPGMRPSTHSRRS